MAEIVDLTVGVPANIKKWSDRLIQPFGGPSGDLTRDFKDASVNFAALDPFAKLVVNCYAESNDYYSTWRIRMQNWDKQYFGIPEPKKYDWQSNLWVPATHRAIWIVVARIWKVLFGGASFFGIQGIEDGDVPFEEMNEQIIKYQWRQSKSNYEFLLGLLQLCIRGTTIWKVVQTSDVRNRSFAEYGEEPVYQPVRDESGQIVLQVDESGSLVPQLQQVGTRKTFRRATKAVEMYRGPKLHNIDLYDYFPDPRILSPEDLSGYQIHRSWATYGELKAKEKHVGKDGIVEGIYTNVDAVRGSKAPVKLDYMSQHRRLFELGMRTPTSRGDSSVILTDSDAASRAEARSRVKLTNTMEQDVELLEWHGPLALTADGDLRRSIITVANRQFVIRKPEEDPYWHGYSPFIRAGFKPPHTRDFFWQGICEIIEPLQAEMNTKRNQRIDNVNQVLQPIMEYLDGSIDTEVLRNFKRRPGAMLRVKTPAPRQHIVWDVTPDVTGSAVREEEAARHDLETAIPAPSIYASTDLSQVHSTAEGVSIAHREADANMAMLIELIEDNGLIPVVERFHWLNQQFIQMPYRYRLLGPKAIALQQVALPEEVGRNFDFYAIGAMTAMKRVVNQQALMRFLEIARTIQQPIMSSDGKQYMPDLKRLMERIWQLDDLGELKDLFIEIPQAPAVPEMGTNVPGMSPNVLGTESGMGGGEQGGGFEGGEGGGVAPAAGEPYPFGSMAPGVPTGPRPNADEFGGL